MLITLLSAWMQTYGSCMKHNIIEAELIISCVTNLYVPDRDTYLYVSRKGA